MALRVCLACTTAYAAGLAGCPHCGGTDHHEEGSMPKITRHGGPTVAAEQRPDLEQPAGEDETSTAGKRDDDEGGASSPGSSSSASSEKPKTSSAPNATSRPSPARSTESPSGQGRRGSSTARTTGGSGTA